MIALAVHCVRSAGRRAAVLSAIAGGIFGLCAPARVFWPLLVGILVGLAISLTALATMFDSELPPARAVATWRQRRAWKRERLTLPTENRRRG